MTLDKNKLVTARKASGYTQYEMAKNIGVSERTYQRYEKDPTGIPNLYRNRILEALGKTELELCIPGKQPDDQEIQMQIDTLVGTILDKFGPQHQACILIEEMSELTKVLCKIQRGKFNKGKLNEEFTHVQVSCEVIRRLMAIKNADISEQVRLKLEEYASDIA